MIKNLIKIKKIKLKISHLFICLFIYLLITQTATAAPLSLGIYPAIIEIKAIPPTTAVSSLTVLNKSDTEIPLRIQLSSFTAKGENGELEYFKETQDIFKYIQVLDDNVPVENITLGPQQKKVLNLSVNIPPDANISGGRDYYFSIVFVSTDTPPTESSSSVSQIGIATNVLLSIGLFETPKAVLEEFSSNIFFEKGPVPFTIRVRNAGTHFIKPKGEIIVKNMFGQNIGKLDLSSVNILSDSIRAIPNENSADFKRPTALWKENFLLGLYTATLNISMSDEGPVFTRTSYFFAFPFQILIIIAAITVAMIIIRNRLKVLDKNRK